MWSRNAWWRQTIPFLRTPPLGYHFRLSTNEDYLFIYKGTTAMKRNLRIHTKQDFKMHENERQRSSSSAIKRFLLGSVLTVASMLLVSACEQDTIAEELFKDEDHPSSSSSASSPSSSSSNVSSDDLSGTWSGRAGTAQGHVTLRLSQSGNSLSGSWTYSNGDRRSCKGTRSGNSITLKDQNSGGSTWHASVSQDGRTITGTGYKTDGRTYAISFSR